MKKYIIAIAAVIVVAAIGIYFRNPDLFQGRIFDMGAKTTTEKYIVKKGFCSDRTWGTTLGTQGGEPKDMTGVERKTVDNSQGTPHETKEKETKPTIDLDNMPTTTKTQTGTVAPGTYSTGSKDEGSSKPGDSGPKITWQDCGCADSGKIKHQVKNANGDVISEVWCQSHAKSECLDENSEYKCPPGTNPDVGQIASFCDSVKAKQCFQKTQPGADDISICKIFETGKMNQNCLPSKECEEIIGWFKSGLVDVTNKTYEKYKTEKMKETDDEILKEAQKAVGQCLSATFIQAVQ